MALICSVEDFRQEIAALRDLAGKGFLEPSSTLAFERVKAAVESVLTASQRIRIQVTDEAPIRTLPCGGGYERGNGGTYTGVYAHVTFVWEVDPLGVPSRKARDRAFAIAGLASTLITLYDQSSGGDHEELGSWRLEVAHDEHGNEPGAFFHAQVGGTNRTPEWSKGMPVPRLGVLPFTPMLALEFVLGELFQERWPSHLVSAGSARDRWAKLHSDRLQRYASWLQDNWRNTQHPSPLISYKQAKPPDTLFVGEKRFKQDQLRPRL